MNRRKVVVRQLASIFHPVKGPFTIFHGRNQEKTIKFIVEIRERL